jgi:hypothetical protein
MGIVTNFRVLADADVGENDEGRDAWRPYYLKDRGSLVCILFMVVVTTSMIAHLQ